MSDERAYSATLAELRKALDATAEQLLSGQSIDHRSMSAEQVAFKYIELYVHYRTIKAAIDTTVRCWRAAHETQETKKDAGSREVY